ncbi:MAG: oligopeptide ABC transporter ATP-binding protein OppD, partial [Actinobacteria bacterium]|nr:oligopeptide ABC transporter ATP-binding protein OppD [Actinomycetota bacterium]
QRVLIAAAIANSPDLLLADEPTTALDVTVQDQILKLLVKLKEEGGLSLVIVTHNFGVVAEVCDSVAVMYAGRIVESGPTSVILTEPLHPYTRGLLAAVPTMEETDAGRPLRGIPGSPPVVWEGIEGCAFSPRCPEACAECSAVEMTLEPVATGHLCACPWATTRRVQG